MNRTAIGGAILIATAIGACIYCCRPRGDDHAAADAKAKTSEVVQTNRADRTSANGGAFSITLEDRNRQIEERRKARESKLKAREEERKARREAREKSPERLARREHEERRWARREALRLRDEYENAMDDEMREHYRRIPVGYWRHRAEERKRHREEFRKRHGLDDHDRDFGDGRDSGSPASDDLAVEHD